MKLAYNKIRKYLAFGAFAAIMATATDVSAQRSVKAELDSNVIEIASQARLTITASTKPGSKVSQPDFKNNQIVPTLEVVSTPKPDTIVGMNQEITYKFHYLITSFEDSAYTIPRIAVVINGDSVFTEPLNITFTLLQGIDSTFTSSIDTTRIIKIFDIKDVKDAPWTFAEFWARFGNIILILLLVALVASAATYVIIRRRRNKPIIPFSKPKEPAEKVAIRRLNQLKDKRLCESGKVKEYYTDLTEIIKTYISDRFGYSVMESTSAETLVALKGFVGGDAPAFKDLKSIFDVADFVKFAKMQPLPDENDRCMRLAYDIVETTMPQQAAEDENAANESAQQIKN